MLQELQQNESDDDDGPERNVKTIRATVNLPHQLEQLLH